MLFNRAFALALPSACAKPLGRFGLGIAVFSSVLMHVLFLLALSQALRPKPAVLLGSLHGSQHQGLRAYFVQSARVAEPSRQEKSPSTKIFGNDSSAVTEAAMSDARPVAEVQPAPSVQAEDLAGRRGISTTPPSIERPPGRQSGFFGLPKPMGSPEGVVPLNAEWAMRRQSVLQSLGLQMEFMRRAFVLDDGVSCLVSSAGATCNPPNAELMGFLSSRHIQLHLLDPSLSGMQWRSHGYGQWSFEFQDTTSQPDQ